MKQIASAIALLGLAAATSGGNAQTHAQAPASPPARHQAALQPAPHRPTSIESKPAPDWAPNEDELKRLVGNATVGSLALRGGYDPTAPVSDRILDGFEAAPTALTTTDGQVITWGFKYKEANFQSVVIADAAGRLELAAAVTDVVRLTDWSRGADKITSIVAYQEAVKRLNSQPHVALFARDQAALEASSPLFMRWMQANLLGFNTSCAKHAVACALMPDIDVPIDAYIASGRGAAPVKMAVPDLPAAPIPLDAFTQ